METNLKSLLLALLIPHMGLALMALFMQLAPKLGSREAVPLWDDLDDLEWLTDWVRSLGQYGGCTGILFAIKAENNQFLLWGLGVWLGMQWVMYHLIHRVGDLKRSRSQQGGPSIHSHKEL